MQNEIHDPVSLENMRVTVVDDSRETCDVLVRHMKLEGYATNSFYDPVEALEALKADPPDLVLLDHNMPKMTGLEVLAELRAHPPTFEMPVIMVTAAGEVSDIVRGLDVGANDYVTKPPQFEILAARVRTQLKIKQLQDQRSQANRELRELNTIKDKFLQIAAHDLRNPLNNIVLSIELLTRAHDKAGAPVSQFVPVTEAMRTAASTMQTIVNDFLDFQALRTGTINLDFQPMSLNTAVQSVLSQYEFYATEKKVNMQVHLDPSLPTIDGDINRLMQVIANLVSNAIKFSPQGTRVGVRTRMNDQYVMCEVIDTGPGIPEEEMDMLFKEFSRLSNKPTGGEKSSGVGLSIARQLIEMHDGKIGAKSQLGHGSMFWFALPR